MTKQGRSYAVASVNIKGHWKWELTLMEGNQQVSTLIYSAEDYLEQAGEAYDRADVLAYQEADAAGARWAKTNGQAIKRLFRRFYGLARMTRFTEYGECPFADEHEIEAIAAAVRAGISNTTILGLKHAAWLALEERDKPVSEPSRNSVAIQSMVFTFGRVRRTFA
jgi:hypothetical protein